MNPHFEYYELTINDFDLIVSHHIDKDLMIVRKWDGNPLSIKHKLPKLFEATGFEEFCNEEGYLDINGMTYSPELETWVNTDYKIDMYDFAQNEDWITNAIEEFISKNYAEQLV